MEEKWKINVMHNVLRKLQDMKQMQREVMEVQKREVLMELEKAKEETSGTTIFSLTKCDDRDKV